MVRPISDGIGTATDLPWIWTTPITCPRCVFAFYLTPEDTQYGVVNQIGSSGQLNLGWKQLVEGDPMTAAVDTAHLHVDPAQVVGQCPNCGFNPLVVRGPRYGMAKITLGNDPAVGDVGSYIAAGATHMAWYEIEEDEVVATDLAGCFVTVSGTVVGVVTDVNGDAITAPAVARDVLTGVLNTHWTMLFVRPNRNVVTAEAQHLDADMVDTMARYGLAV